MAIFSVQIADEDIVRVLMSLAVNYNRPETVPNPNYVGPTVPNPNYVGPSVPNPDWAGPLVPNPDYTGSTVENPSFDPDEDESEENPSTLPSDEPEFIANPEPEFIPSDEPEFIASDEPEFIPNPESLPVFANRMVRQFLAENVRAYEARLAREAAEQALAGSSEPTIIDPQLEV
jgi:hypothetical protein